MNHRSVCLREPHIPLGTVQRRPFAQQKHIAGDSYFKVYAGILKGAFFKKPPLRRVPLPPFLFCIAFFYAAI